VLYKFLTSCRGPRATTDTASCWPCPTASDKYGNWNTASGFSQPTYGPLYSLQDATKALSGIGGTAAAPAANRLQGNFPNPFNPQTAIRFSSARAGRVDVRIFDVAGRLVQTISRNATQGVNEVRWNGQSSDGRSLASGVYFVKVKYPDGSESLNGLKIAIVR
jgi:flagellar hook assembly protein FlgD